MIRLTIKPVIYCLIKGKNTNIMVNSNGFFSNHNLENICQDLNAFRCSHAGRLVWKRINLKTKNQSANEELIKGINLILKPQVY